MYDLFGVFDIVVQLRYQQDWDDKNNSSLFIIIIFVYIVFSNNTI